MVLSRHLLEIEKSPFLGEVALAIELRDFSQLALSLSLDVNPKLPANFFSDSVCLSVIYCLVEELSCSIEALTMD